MPPSASVANTVKFHVSLNTADVAASVNYYRNIFGVEPARQSRDYAKFEIEEPPLVLSLIPGSQNAGGALNHLGIRLRDFEAMIAMQARLENAGIKTNREDGVQCCHSHQTKFWVNDPNRVLWEFYILHDDDHETPKAHSQNDSPPADKIPASEPVVWQHQIPDPFPARIPHDDNSINRIVLEGTANLSPSSVKLDHVLAESFRVLRPSGEISLHGLAADKYFTGIRLNLPGPAAAVEFVPVESEPMKAMIRAGFARVRYEKLSSAPNFVIDGVQMREILLTARKPGHRPRTANSQVIYLGPLAQVTDDFGNIFPRGERVSLNIHDYQSLSQSEAASQFAFLATEKCY
ncbi:MAG TPA: ArsI/CadI family heavy metal resistance metalloenzyme [Verrucomicrobiae bacterium]|jgi:catechol 2,3-dioxygenase-like lactoylglutathione lyase family enzyme|nr:ArsI/CadI family heavy metal resistance metalloenzyme [Verrucomicrobiae bacterium]